MYIPMLQVISICLFYVKYMQDSHEYGNNTRKKYDNKEEIVIWVEREKTFSQSNDPLFSQTFSWKII